MVAVVAIVHLRKRLHIGDGGRHCRARRMRLSDPTWVAA